MLRQDIIDAIEMRDADDDDFAQPPGELRLPAHGAVMVEPGLRQRRAVQQELVDIEEPAATARLDAGDHLAKLGMFSLFDQRNARHEIPAIVLGGKPELRAGIAIRPAAGKVAWTAGVPPALEP